MADKIFATTADHAACRSMIITGSKSFFAASKLLPKRFAEPAFALYSFCRLADDTIDVIGGQEDAVANLRRRLSLIYRGTPAPYPSDRALADVVRRYAVPQALLEALIEGLAWDVENRDYETIDDLHAYSVRVAGTVGMVMALIMGVRDRFALARACDLGVAMQLTNIARDIGEDAREGRVYVPKSWMCEVGIDPEAWLSRPHHSPALGSLVRRLLKTADLFYLRSEAGIGLLPLSCRPAIMAARLIYAEIGKVIAANGYDSINQRAFVPSSTKLSLLSYAVLSTGWHRVDREMPVLAAALQLIDAVQAQNETLSTAAPEGSIGWVIDLFTRLEIRDQMARSVGPREPVAENA